MVKELNGTELPWSEKTQFGKSPIKVDDPRILGGLNVEYKYLQTSTINDVIFQQHLWPEQFFFFCWEMANPIVGDDACVVIVR